MTAAASIQNISGLSQGPLRPFSDGLSVLHCDPQRESTMSEQAADERRGWASDILWVVLYSILVLLIMVLWVHVPA